MNRDLLVTLLAAAEAHGTDSDPDHEVGDLQGLLYSCWALLTDAQRRAVFTEHEELVNDWVGAR